MRATEFKKARAAAKETASDMEIDAQDSQPAGEDLYSRLKLSQRQQEFNEIQVCCFLAHCLAPGARSHTHQSFISILRTISHIKADE